MFLIRPDYAFAVAAQCVLVSLGIGYLVATLSAWGFSLLPLLLAEALAVASPLLGHTLMYLWKDNAMTLGVTLLFAQTVNVYFSRGAWLARRRNALALGAGGQQKRAHGRRHADADGGNIRLDILHCVVYGKSAGDAAAG